MIKFEKISKYKDLDFEMPQRKTKYSAGYDFAVVEDTVIPSYLFNVGAMLLSVFTQSEIKELIAETKFGSYISNIQNISQEELNVLIQDNLPEVTEILQKSFSLDLNQMKNLVKEQNLKLTLVPTGVKAYMQDNQYLQLAIRSSIPLNNYIMLGNGVGIVDSDYVDNIDNEGHIFFEVINLSPFEITVKKGDIIGQGMFIKYNVTDDDMAGGERVGGAGSTTK